MVGMLTVNHSGKRLRFFAIATVICYILIMQRMYAVRTYFFTHSDRLWKCIFIFQGCYCVCYVDVY